VVSLFDGVVDYHRLADDNAHLRQQVADARSAQVSAADAQRENAELKALLGLQGGPGPRSVAAQVVTGPQSNFQLTVVIDRGSAAGVRTGMPVTSGHGLVGRITAVSRTQATVLLVTDPGFALGVRLSPGGAIAVASGQGAGRPLAVGLVDPAAAVAPGAAVVTSGLRPSPYPPGVPVGTVHSAMTAPGALRQVVQVDPTVDVDRLTFVDVLLTNGAQ
jgi:rod shape-determining protein MreC